MSLCAHNRIPRNDTSNEVLQEIDMNKEEEWTKVQGKRAVRSLGNGQEIHGTPTKMREEEQLDERASKEVTTAEVIQKENNEKQQNDISTSIYYNVNSDKNDKQTQEQEQNERDENTIMIMRYDPEAKTEQHNPKESNTKTQTYMVTAKFPLSGKDKQEVNVYFKFVNLLGRMFMHDHVELVQFQDEQNPIDTGPEIPNNEKDFKKYCYKCHVAREKTLHCLFKIKCYDTFFYKMKQDMFLWLLETKVFMTPTFLNTAKNCIIGWLVNSQPRESHRFSIQKGIAKRIKSEKQFQLVPRNVRQSNSEISTKALAIECAVDDAESLEASFSKKQNVSRSIWRRTI